MENNGQSLQHSGSKYRESTKFDANLVHAMDFASVELFSVTYLGLHLARKCETQQTCKQTVKQLARRQRFTRYAPDYTIINSSSRDHFLNHVNETNGTCKGLKNKSHFNRRLGSIVVW